MTSAQSLQHLIRQYPEAGEVVFAPPLELFAKPVVAERPFDLTKSATGLSDRPAIREPVNE